MLPYFYSLQAAVMTGTAEEPSRVKLGVWLALLELADEENP